MSKRHSRKGAAISMPVILALVLIVIVVLGSLGTMNVAKGLVDYIGSILRGRPTGYAFQSLIDATKCSYYRCSEGCEYAKSYAYDSDFDCAAYCKDEWTDASGKICNQNAKERPVEIKLDGDTPVNENDFNYMNAGEIDISCISPVTYGSSFYGMATLKIQDSAIKSRGEGLDCTIYEGVGAEACKSGTTEVNCGLSDATVSTGRRYLWYDDTATSAGNFLWSDPTNASLPCDKLNPKYMPCMRLRPTNASITEGDDHYNISFYIEGETNIKDDSSDDAVIEFFSVLGNQWNDMSKVGFKKQDFESVELQLVDDSCNSLGSNCPLRAVQTTKDSSSGGPSADVLVYNAGESRLVLAGGADGNTNAWGVAMFYCKGANFELKASDLADKDLRIMYTFKMGGSFDPYDWYDFPGSKKEIAFYIGGMPFKIGQSNADLYWSPPLPGVQNTNVKFTEKVQAIDEQGKSSKGSYCTAGNSELYTKDALISIADWTDKGFPDRMAKFVPEIRCSVLLTDYNFPWNNCRKCGKGCPIGMCDDSAGSCSIAWSGAVSIKLPPKNFVCCPDGDSWQEGTKCPDGRTPMEQSECDPNSCAQQCDAVGYKYPAYGTDPEMKPGDAYYRVCQCLSPKTPVVTSTTTTTTTTTLPSTTTTTTTVPTTTTTTSSTTTTIPTTTTTTTTVPPTTTTTVPTTTTTTSTTTTTVPPTTTTTVAPTTTTTVPSCSYASCDTCTTGGCKWWSCSEGWPWASSGCDSNDGCDPDCWCTWSSSGCGGATTTTTTTAPPMD